MGAARILASLIFMIGGSGCSLLYDSGPRQAAHDAAAVTGDATEGQVDGAGPQCWSRALRLAVTQDSSEELVHVPILVRLTPQHIGALQLEPDLSDLRFTDPVGALLPFEIDHEDAEGNVAVWVRQTVDPNPSVTEIVARGGNPEAELPQNHDEVWSNDYVAVYHLDEVLSPTIQDSSGHGNSGVSESLLDRSDGVIGFGLAFPGVASAILVEDTSLLDASDAVTLEAWARPTAAGDGSEYALFKSSAYNLATYRWFSNGETGGASVQVWADGAPSAQSGPLLSVGSWTSIVGTYDGALLRFYRDGYLHDSEDVTGAIPQTAGSLQIGHHFDGYLDEVRVSRAVRSAAWIAFQYRNVLGQTPAEAELREEEWCR